jgi:hypothetical protein
VMSVKETVIAINNAGGIWSASNVMASKQSPDAWALGLLEVIIATNQQRHLSLRPTIPKSQLAAVTPHWPILPWPISLADWEGRDAPEIGLVDCVTEIVTMTMNVLETWFATKRQDQATFLDVPGTMSLTPTFVFRHDRNTLGCWKGGGIFPGHEEFVIWLYETMNFKMCSSTAKSTTRSKSPTFYWIIVSYGRVLGRWR